MTKTAMEDNGKRIMHPFGPLYNGNSRILILGSFPSVKSREQNFFYGHPQNRFWKVLAALFDRKVPQTIPEKKARQLSVISFRWASFMVRQRPKWAAGWAVSTPGRERRPESGR